MTLEALNPVEAGVGDRVSVKLETAALIKNAGTLIGIPILALILGWASSLMVPDRGLPGVPLKLLLVFLSLPLGIAVGFAFYRRFSRRNNPVITRVIEKRADRVSRFEELQ